MPPKKSPSKAKAKPKPKPKDPKKNKKASLPVTGATRWGLAIEYEYIMQVPRGEGAAGGQSGMRVMSDGKGGAFPKFSRRTLWTPVALPSMVQSFMQEKAFLPAMNMSQDSNVISAMELSTRDPHSRTVGAIADELRTSLASIAAIASTSDFIEHLIRMDEETTKAFENDPDQDKTFQRMALAESADVIAAAKRLRDIAAPAAAASESPRPLPRYRGRLRPDPSGPPTTLLAEHGADIATYASHPGAEDTVVYTGSMHINVTLPYSPSEDTGPGSAFVERHRRAAQCLQWLQPLLVVVLGSPHPLYSMNGDAFPAISFRQTFEMNGMVTNNVAERGLNRFRHILREDQDFIFRAHDGDDMKERVNLADRIAKTEGQLRDNIRAKGEESKREPLWLRGMRNSDSAAATSFVSRAYRFCPCMPTMGSDFRRPSSEGEQRSGAFGFEFRTLDRVPPGDLDAVLRLLWYTFDASVDLPAGDKVLASPSYNAARSTAFLPFMIAAARKGSAAAVTEDYAAALRRVFNIRASALRGSMTAHEALQAVSQSLFERFGGGKGAYSRVVDTDSSGNPFAEAPVLPDLNAAGREYHRQANVLSKSTKKTTSEAKKASSEAKKGAKGAKGKEGSAVRAAPRRAARRAGG